MKKNHRKDQNMESSYITTNSCCCLSGLVFSHLIGFFLATQLLIADTIKVALGIGNWALGRYCLEVTQAKHCIVLYAKIPNT